MVNFFTVGVVTIYRSPSWKLTFKLCPWLSEQLNDLIYIYIYFLLHLGKKTICAQLLDKENYSLKGNIKEKKIQASRKCFEN